MPISARTPYPRVSFDEWPEQDRRLFLQAQGNGRPLSGTTKKKRTPRTWRALRYSYSHWIGFLKVRRPGMLDLPPGQRIRNDTVDEYMQFLSVTSNQMSISIELQRLYLVIRDFTGENKGEWEWLWLASRRLFKTVPKQVRPAVDSTAVNATAVSLMRRAQQRVADLGYVSEQAAIEYRKGLEMMVQVTESRRKRVWQGLRLGLNIRKSGPGWRLFVERKDDKSRRPSRPYLPKQLWPWIDDYVQRFRPALLGPDTHDGFWASRSGRPMSGSTIYQSLTRTTKAELGIAVSPHQLRRAVATHWNRIAPDQPEKAARHLTHRHPRITIKHYTAPSGYAGDGLAQAWDQYRPQAAMEDANRSAASAVALGNAQKGKDGAAS